MRKRSFKLQNMGRPCADQRSQASEMFLQGHIGCASITNPHQLRLIFQEILIALQALCCALQRCSKANHSPGWGKGHHCCESMCSLDAECWAQKYVWPVQEVQ